MLTLEDRKRILAEEEERLRVRRRLEQQSETKRVPWLQWAALFLVGAALGFALIRLYPEQPPASPRVIVVEPGWERR